MKVVAIGAGIVPCILLIASASHAQDKPELVRPNLPKKVLTANTKLLSPKSAPSLFSGFDKHLDNLRAVYERSKADIEPTVQTPEAVAFQKELEAFALLKTPQEKAMAFERLQSVYGTAIATTQKNLKFQTSPRALYTGVPEAFAMGYTKDVKVRPGSKNPLTRAAQSANWTGLLDDTVRNGKVNILDDSSRSGKVSILDDTVRDNVSILDDLIRGAGVYLYVSNPYAPRPLAFASGSVPVAVAVPVTPDGNPVPVISGAVAVPAPANGIVFRPPYTNAYLAEGINDPSFVVIDKENGRLFLGASALYAGKNQLVGRFIQTVTVPAGVRRFHIKAIIERDNQIFPLCTLSVGAFPGLAAAGAHTALSVLDDGDFTLGTTMQTLYFVSSIAAGIGDYKYIQPVLLQCSIERSATEAARPETYRIAVDGICYAGAGGLATASAGINGRLTFIEVTYDRNAGNLKQDEIANPVSP